MKRIILSILFFVFSPILLVFALYLINTPVSKQLSFPPPPPKVLGLSSNNSDELPFVSSLSYSVGTTDARKLIVAQYLKQYNSPLSGYSDKLLATSDYYGLDYRLLVAIAQQESNLCKRIPENSYNCWGFGIYGDKVTRFENYPQAIETVAKTLRNEYLNKGLHTPEQIMAKYTPPSLAKGGPWAKGVNQFLNELE